MILWTVMLYLLLSISWSTNQNFSQNKNCINIIYQSIFSSIPHCDNKKCNKKSFPNQMYIFEKVKLIWVHCILNVHSHDLCIKEYSQVSNKTTCIFWLQADKLFKRYFLFPLPLSRTKWRIHLYSLKIQLMKHWNCSKIYSDCRLIMNFSLKLDVISLFVLSPCPLICQWSVVWARGAQWLPNW